MCDNAGGTVEVALLSKPLSKFVFSHEERNHIFEVVNLFHNLLPQHGKEKCKLSGSLTNSGNVSLSLEALNAGDHMLCQNALHSITASFKAVKGKSLRKAVVEPGFEMAPFISLDSWLQGQVIGIQDQVLTASDDFRARVNNKVGETLLEIDEKLPPEQFNGQTLSIFHHCVVTVLVLCIKVIIMNF